jgi:hypothetical protein
MIVVTAAETLEPLLLLSRLNIAPEKKRILIRVLPQPQIFEIVAVN